MVDLIEYPENEIVEDLLVFDTPLLVNCIDARLDLCAFQFEAGIEHSIDGSLDRLPLHSHEVHKRVIEIEYDGADHVS